ncbi:MAG: ROK family protein [Nevskiaceae bacterium]|nr:MAG: ROK family protein [Nevskiaceae bacterium]TBR71366.1 MAG: ROK family protein [Nevskiaceae bacterium]
MSSATLRVGIDLGGTKISGIVLNTADIVVAHARIATPQDDYAATVQAVVRLVQALEAHVGSGGLPVGVGHPGTVSPATGRIKNANSTCLNGKPLARDLAAVLGRPVALANDANCLAASELRGGAAQGCSPVFAVILGTGVGGALAVDGRVVRGVQAIAGEWGHNPLPWARAEWGEMPGPCCWCGRHGCIETWLSGTGLAADYVRAGGYEVRGEEIVRRAAAGEALAQQALVRYEDRLARALAHVINLIDPEVVVLGGGLSSIAGLYEEVPQRWGEWVFSDTVVTQLVPARFGDDSGVRGAAALAAP